MALEWLRNQYLSGKHTNNASACVCCTLVIKYWLWLFFCCCKSYQLRSKVGYAAYGGGCSSKDGHAFVSDVNGDRPRGCLSWNPATNSRCQDVSLAVAVTSVWASMSRLRGTKKERCLAQLFSSHPSPPPSCPAQCLIQKCFQRVRLSTAQHFYSSLPFFNGTGR